MSQIVYLEILTNHVLLSQVDKQASHQVAHHLESLLLVEVVARAVIVQMVSGTGLGISNTLYEAHRRSRKSMKRIQRNSAQCRVSFCG